MDPGSKPCQGAGDPGVPRRLPARATTRIECRKGPHGLGPNLAEAALDLCDTEARLLLKEPLGKGTEVELLIHGAGPAVVRRLGRVSAAAPLDDGRCIVRVALDRSLSYSEVQRLTRPAQTLQ